jgi:hypothetical protein
MHFWDIPGAELSTIAKCSHKRRSHTLRQPQILLEFYRRYYNHTAILDRLLEEVSAYVTMAYDIARSGRHNTEKNFLYRNETRKSISNRSIILKGEKSPVVVSRVEGSYYTIKKGSL